MWHWGLVNPSTMVTPNIVGKLHLNGYSMMSQTFTLGIIDSMVGCATSTC